MSELDLETRILNTRKALDTLREDKVRKEERLSNLKRQNEEIENQLKSLGLDPNKLADIIKEKNAELTEKVEKFEQDTAKLAEALQSIQNKLNEVE